MNILELIQKRYSTKKYNAHKAIPQEKIEDLKEILRLTPSSINIQPWKFTFVQNPEVKAKLASVSMHNTEKINQAQLLVVFSVADDLDAFQKVVDTELPQARRDWYNQIKTNTPEADLKTWLSKQVYIALGVGLTASIALGLDSTAMEGIESDQQVIDATTKFHEAVSEYAHELMRIKACDFLKYFLDKNGYDKEWTIQSIPRLYELFDIEEKRKAASKKERAPEEL